jgi:multidrug efflux system membrane fusion protein
MLGFAGNSLSAEVNALLDWSDKRRLGTTVSGKVDQVHVRPGMQVKAGAILVEIDQRYFDFIQQKAKARMQAARLQLEEAEREQQRAIELFDRTVLSTYDRQKADIDLAAAQAVFAEARADFDKARLDLEYSKISAPYDGIVLSVSIAPGEVVVNENESIVLVELARSNEMLVRSLLTNEQLSTLKIGQQLDVAFRGKWLAGKVHSLSLQTEAADPKTIKYEVAVSLSIEAEAFARAGEASAIRLPD